MGRVVLWCPKVSRRCCICGLGQSVKYVHPSRQLGPCCNLTLSSILSLYFLLEKCSIDKISFVSRHYFLLCCMWHWQATVMPTHEAIAPTPKLSHRDSKGGRRVRRSGNARTGPPSSVAAVTSNANPIDSVTEASSVSSHQTEASADARSVQGASSDQDLCLACPYAKLNSIATIESLGDSPGTGRPRCWSRSYPSIPRLKYAEVLPEYSFATHLRAQC